MNILAIRNSEIIGGAELYYSYLADAFAKHQLDYRLVLFTNNIELGTLLRSHEIETYVFQSFTKEVGTKRDLLSLLLHLPYYLYRNLLEFNKLKTTSKPDVILFSGRTEKIILTPIFRLYGIPIIWLEHGHAFTPTMSKVVLFIYKIVSKLASTILIESKDTEYNLISNGLPRKKIRSVASGTDTNYFKTNRLYHERSIVVGYMASLTSEKGIWTCLKVAERIVKYKLPITFLILGIGPELIASKRFVQDRKMNKSVKFKGFRSNPKIYLSKMNIFLSPITHSGGLSLSVQCAMSMGVVPIVSNVGGNKELVLNGIGGYVYSNNYIDRTVKMIIKLYYNRTLLKKLSKKARKHIVSKFGYDIFTRKWRLILSQYN